MKKLNRTRPQKLGIKPTHPVAKFTFERKRMDLLKRFQICLADLFPPGLRLTANEFKVLFVLRAATMGKTNLAAVDQEKIAEISGVKQQNVARAIAGLRGKGLIRKTWMEAGSKMFRNIYALWLPPELMERDAKAMLKKRDKAITLEKQADNLEQQAQTKEADKLRERAQKVRANTCSLCGGDGIVHGVYLPLQGRSRARWCNCSVGIKKAEEVGCPKLTFVPDDLLEKLFGNNR